MAQAAHHFELTPAIFVGDADNLAHIKDRRGFIDIPAFARLLKTRGVTSGVIVGNWFSPIEAKLWEAAGFNCVETRCNADERIKEILVQVALNGARRILLGSGDGRAFAKTVSDLEDVGVHVHVLANRHAMSPELQSLASGYAFSDRYVHLRGRDVPVGGG